MCHLRSAGGTNFGIAGIPQESPATFDPTRSLRIVNFLIIHIRR
jgi:hypothetical protein